MKEAAWYTDFHRFIQLKGLRERSEKSYLGWLRQLATHYHWTDIKELSSTQVLDFLIHLQSERDLAPSTVNQALNAVRTFYRDHLDKRWKIWAKVKIKRIEPLPHVLTREEVSRLLSTFRDGRYRAFFTIVYLCGLRLSEAIHIKPKDIDGQRLIIRIKEGKGGRPREVPITAELLGRTRTFWKSHRNPDWLFPAVGRGWKDSGKTLREALYECRKPMSKAGAWAAFNLAKHECGLMKKHEKLTIHTLRHSYATHMLEGGCSMRQVSSYLGHRSLKPTLVYLHLTEISEGIARDALQTLAATSTSSPTSAPRPR